MMILEFAVGLATAFVLGVLAWAVTSSKRAIQAVLGLGILLAVWGLGKAVMML